MTQSGGISVHAVDVTRGAAAMGLSVRIIGPDGVICAGRIGPKGTLTDSTALSRPFPEGDYRAEFDVADYFRAQGIPLPDPAFQDVSVFGFHITDRAAHVHLPFKFSPWGFSLFRGTP